jgi:ADP-heptose:LPS heptosyltransferase
MKYPPGQIKKIGILRALQLGDMMCVVPAVKALRAAYPAAEIVLFGLPWARNFVDRFRKYFDRFEHFPGYPGLPEQVFHQELYHVFQNKIKAEQFDLIIQMQGNGNIVNKMMRDWEARNLAGFSIDPVESSGDFLTYPGRIHEIDRHLSLMEHLGIKSMGRELEFPVTEEDVKDYERIQVPFKNHRYVCIHPGSRGSYRQWPPENFAAAANLCAEYGYGIVLTGTEEEQTIISSVKRHLKTISYDASGKTGLGAVAVLIKNASLIVCNCTGVSHIASAVQTPGIIISMDGEPERWAPLNQKIHRTINWLTVPDLSNVLRELLILIKRKN